MDLNNLDLNSVVLVCPVVTTTCSIDDLESWAV